MRPTHEPGVSTNAQWTPDKDPHAERREIIRRDISLRLRRICPHYTDEQFADLVESMTERQLKGERRINRFPV